MADFGLNLFKSADEAYKQDVVPRARPSNSQLDLGDPYGWAVPTATPPAPGAPASTPPQIQQSPALMDADPYAWANAPAAPAAPKAPEQGDFSRGMSVSGKQLRQTAYGTAALLGDTLGSDTVKNWGLKGFQAAEKEVQAISKESDSFTNAVQSGEIGKWLTYSSGYLLGQVAELGVASLAGAALGTLAAPGGGTVAGAAAGAIEKGAVEAGVRGFVGKMIDKQVTANVARGMTAEAATQAAVKTVYGTIGATTANTFLNATQELGSIYGDAVEEAALTGKEYSLGKVWLSGIAATAVDSWADSKAVGNLMSAMKGGKGVGGIAMEAFKGGFREGMTEGVQTAIERWGADKDLASKEAFKEYIDSAAVGVLGGTVSGGGAAAVKKAFSPSEKPKADADLTGDISTEAASDKAQPNLQSPVSIDREELLSTLRKPEAMAYLYQKADDEQKANIEKAIEKAGAIEAFNAVKGNMDAIQEGEKLLLEFPEYQQALDSAITSFAKKPDLNIKKGNTIEAPPSQFDQQPPGSTTLNETKPEGSAQQQKPMDRVVSYIQSQGDAISEEMRNDPLVAQLAAASAVAFKNEKASDPRSWTPEESAAWKAKDWEAFSKIRGYTDKEIAQYKKFQSLMQQVREKYGEDAIFEIENPDVQKGVFDAIYGKGAYAAQEKLHSDAKIKVDVAERQQEMRAVVQALDDAYLGTGKEPTKLEQAKQEFKDAASQALDIVMDVSNTKMNITGKQYTVSDLPKAIQRVMEALVKMGYYKLEEITAELVKRMRDNKSWSHLVGKVTPAMVRNAYKNLPSFKQKQSDEEVDAISSTQLRDAVKKGRTAIQESNDLDNEIKAENKRLSDKFGKDWDKTAPVAERENLKKMIDRQKELVGEIEKDNSGSAPAAKEEVKEEKEKRQAAQEPEVDFGTYKAEEVKEEPAMLSEDRLSTPLKQLLKGLKRAQINQIRRALVNVDGEWLNKLGNKGLMDHLLPLSNQARIDALISLADRSADELVQIGDRMAQLNTPEAKQILEFKRRIYGIMNLLNLNAPEAELTTTAAGDVSSRAGVGEEISVASAQQQAQFLRGTIAKIQKAIDDIDFRLNNSRVINEGETRFVGQDESDENAYLWGEQGFRTAKNLPQERLLEIRRQLVDQVREMQSRSTRGIAELFKRSAKNAEYLLSIERTKALKEGIPDIVVDPIFNQAREAIVGLMNDKATKLAIEVPSVQEALKIAVDEAPLEAGDVVNQLADGIKNRTLSQDEMFTLASTAIRSGRLNQGQLLQALRDRGIDVPQEMLSASPLLAFQTRMLDYLRQHGGHPSYRLAWLTSMDQLVKRHPTLMKLNIFPEAERVAYEMWKERLNTLEQRRTKDFVMENSSNAEDAFRDMLFMKYSLSQMRGAVPIPEREMMALKGTIGDLQEAWMQDVNFALKLRPDLAKQLLDPEEGLIAPTDANEFQRWKEKNDAKLDREADAKARIPYYEALAAFDGALPENKMPGSKNEEKAKKMRDIIYRRMKTMIARAEINDLPRIIHQAQEMYTKIASNAKTEAALDQMISDYLDGKQAQDEMINGQTIDQFYGMAERGVVDVDLTEQELDDLDSEAFDFDAEEEQQDESDEDGPLRKRGNWSGVYTAAVVNGWIQKITSKWKAAPQVTVLQNATMLPEPLRSKALARTGDLLDAAGLFDSETGHVYVFSDFIGSEADAQFVLFHEVYGHRGLRQFLGTKFDAFLEQMYRVYPNVREAADRFMQERGVGKLEAIDEVLSDMAGTNPDIGLVKSFIARMVVGLREIGLGRVADWIAKISNVELSYYLKGARDAAQNGGYVNNGAPGVIRLAEAVQHERLSEMYALKGDKTTAYARFNPATQTWFAYFATGDDIRNGQGGAMAMDNYGDLLKLMRSKGHVEFRKRSGVFVADRKGTDLVKLTEITNLSGMKAWMRSMITKYQNEYRPVFDLVDAIRAKGRLTERMDIKDALLRYERKTGAVVDEFRRRFVRPLESLVQEAGKQGATQQIIDRYLLARHAAERNKQIAKINEQFPDGGSGMKTKTAQRYLKQLQKQPYWQALEEIGRITDAISQKKLKYQFDTGMITAKQYQAMQVYKHYVNLSGRSDLKLDEFDDPMMLAGGSKFNVKGKEKRALGRKSEATEILSRTILGMEAALIRGQKNQVSQRVLAFFEANYDPNFVSINRIKYDQAMGDDNMVVEKEDPNYIKNPNVMVAKINGIPNTIEFKDTSPGSFAEAIHGVVGMRDSNALLERLGKFNQIVGQMLTTWNPAWGFVNFARDLQTMFFNAAADGRVTKAQAAAMVKAIPSAIKTAYYMARTENLKNTGVNPDPEMVRIYREMKLNGGLTSFLNRKDLPSQVEDLEKLLGERTKLQNAGDKFMAVMDMIEHNFSLPIEIAPRLAAYKVMREAGMSEAQAAQFAGEITVNFNMRGSVKATRQLYLFFNPAVQGSAKLLSLFGTLTPDYKLKFKSKGFVYVGLWVGLGAMMNLIGRALSDDDEAGRNAIDKLPVYKRATSMVFSADVPGAAIPIPYGWNAFYAMGNFMMDSLLGVQPITTSVKRIAQTTFESFAPLGSAGLDSQTLAGTALKGVAPTAALPIVEWVMNENRYGAPIRREDSVFGGAKLPDSQMAFRSVNPLSASAMQGLNELTGGNRLKSGAIDINPAAVDFIIGSYMPGFINESYKAAGTAARVARGEEVKNTPMPLVDRFTAKVPESFDSGAFRRAKEMVETSYNEYRNMPQNRSEIIAETPGLLRAHAIISSTTQQIRQLRSDLTRMENNPGFSDEEKVAKLNRVREREKQLYNRAVKAVMEAGPQFREAVMASD